MSLEGILLTAAVGAAAAHGAATTDGPLAAPFVWGGHLFLVDVAAKSARRFDLGDLVPEEADLSADGSKIVFDALRPPAEDHQLFLLSVSSGEYHALQIPLASDMRGPRFVGGGGLLFSAPSKPGHDSHTNRFRLHRYTLATSGLEEIKTEDDFCDLYSVPVEHGQIVYVSTSCYVDYALKEQSLSGKHRRTLVNLPAQAKSEIAASPDGTKVVYEVVGRQGLKFLLAPATVTEAPRVLATTWRDNPGALQPRFVSARDMLFLNKDKIWALDADDGGLQEVLSLPPATAAPSRDGGTP